MQHTTQQKSVCVRVAALHTTAHTTQQLQQQKCASVREREREWLRPCSGEAVPPLLCCVRRARDTTTTKVRARARGGSVGGLSLKLGSRSLPCAKHKKTASLFIIRPWPGSRPAAPPAQTKSWRPRAWPSPWPGPPPPAPAPSCARRSWRPGSRSCRAGCGSPR